MKRRDRAFLLGVAIGLAALVVAGATRATDLAFIPRGWLLAFAVWSSFSIGAVALLLIHALTGGSWGYSLAPVLRPTAALTPLAIVAFAPIALSTSAIYPWASGSRAIASDVAHLYLNAPLFDLRAAIALVGLSALGFVGARGRLGPLAAGLGLAFFGLAISVAAVDWFLSFAAPYTATAFASMIAIQDILAMLALAGLILAPTLADRDARDLGGLLIATLLGVVYLELMQFIVSWYGDLPRRVSWYVARDAAPWPGVLIAALCLAILAFCVLLMSRRNRVGLRIASAATLAASVAHFVWLIAPAFAPAGPVVVSGAVIVVVLGLVTIPLGVTARERLEARHARG